MEQLVDTKWLTSKTGDPFADVGGMVIEFLWNLPQFKQSTILDLIVFMADIYINDWNGNLFAFFLNAPMTQAAYTEYDWNGIRYSSRDIKRFKLTEEQLEAAKREDKKISKTVEYYKSLIEETLPSKLGYCHISGQKTRVFFSGRGNEILSGSGTYVNFHPFLQEGRTLSKEMLIRAFFVPFGVLGVGGKETIVVSNNRLICEYFVFQNCLKNWDLLQRKVAKGPLRSSFSQPSRALFSFIDKYINDEIPNINEQVIQPQQSSLHLYHFNNGKTPEINIYGLDNKIFAFYCECLQNPVFKKPWLLFQHKHYDPSDIKNLSFNEQTLQWEKRGQPIPYEEFARWKNLVLHSLLHNIPIRNYFYKWSEGGNHLPWEIIKLYHIHIQQMKPEALDLINRLVEYIVSHNEAVIDKDIDALKGTSSVSEFRSFLSKLQERAYGERNHKGIVTTEEYANYLLPDNRYSRTRDLLLIGIYQKLISSSHSN